VIGNNILLAYADDIVILDESKTDFITSTLKLLENSKKSDLKLMKIKKNIHIYYEEADNDMQPSELDFFNK